MNEQTLLYRFLNAHGRLLYVGISFSVMGRIAGHKAAEWFDEVALITLQRFATRADALRAEIKIIREERPPHNVAGKPQHDRVAERGAADQSHPQPDKTLLTVSEASRSLNIGRTQFYRLVNTGLIRPVKIGKKGIRIPRAELNECVSRLQLNGGAQ